MKRIRSSAVTLFGVVSIVAVATLVPTSFAFAQSSAQGNAGRGEVLSHVVPATFGPNHGLALTTRAKGPLKVSAQVELPIPPGVMTTATEAPNGTVFVAQESTDVPKATVLWAVEDSSSATVAENLKDGASALAADNRFVYVATYKTVTAFSRITGRQIRQWVLPKFSTANTSDADLVSIAAHSGTVLVMLPLGKQVGVYRIDSASSTTPRLIAFGSSAAFGSNGSTYFVASNHRLAAISEKGVVTTGSVLADAPNSEGGGIQYVDAVAGGFVWVSEPAGQGLDTSFSTYKELSLKLVAVSHRATVSEQIVDTASGALVLSGPDGPSKCPQTSSLSTSCVFRISSKSNLSAPTAVGSAIQLLGPAPAVVTLNNAGSHLYVDRLSS